MIEVARHVRTTIRYDGPALVGHDMDVQDLAPALLALADIVQMANRRFNGDKADMRVVVNTDVEQQCFMLDLGLVQSLVDQAKGLFSAEHVHTAKEIAADIGLVTGVTGVGLFQLLKFLARGRTAGTTLQIEQGENGVTILNNSGQVTVTHNTFLLSQDVEVVGKVKAVLRPLSKPGYESMEFIDGDGVPFSASRSDAEEILELPSMVGVDDSDEVHTPITTRVSVKTQRNEGVAKWELKWAARAEWASIEDTEWLGRFQAGDIPTTVPLYLDVQMDMVTSRTNPDAPARFRVLKVLDTPRIIQGEQKGFFDGNDTP